MSEEPEVGGVAQEGAEALGAPRKLGETPRQQIRKAKVATRRRFSAEEKIRIVMEGIQGEEPVSAICRREKIQSTVYYRWLKDFMEAGKRRLRGDTLREAGGEEVEALKAENKRLKELVADYALEARGLKKACWRGDEHVGGADHDHRVNLGEAGGRDTCARPLGHDEDGDEDDAAQEGGDVLADGSGAGLALSRLDCHGLNASRPAGADGGDG